MRERKLFIFCLSFLLISFLGIHFFGKYFLEELRVSKTEEIIPTGEHVTVTGRLYRKEEASDYQILYLKNISVIYQNQSIKESRIIIYDKEKHPELKIGNRIRCSGSLEFFEPALNPGNFDRKFYYQKQNIHACMWTDKVEITENTNYFLQNELQKLRLTWRAYLRNAAGEKYGSILSAMLLGDRSSMDIETKELYQLNGIAHILAISGLHLSFIGHSFYQLVRKGSGSYLAGGIVGLLFMGLYIMMIGVSVSALRAVVMFILRVVADMSGRVYDPLTAVALAGAMVILWQPLSFYDGGFQLSFGAIIGVLFLNPAISRKKKSNHFLYKSILANVSIQIITFPILLYHYYEFPLFSVLLNLIVVPLMSAVLLLAILSILISIVWFVPGEILVQGCIWILEGYEWLCTHILELPYARITTGRPVWYGIACYYVCVCLLFGYFHQAGKKARRRRGIIIMPGIIVLLMSCPFAVQKGLEVTMLDVGQGDCIFLREESMACLIDGGSSSEKQVGKYRIEPFLKSKGVAELDYVFVSHGDSDHISGIREMLKRQKEGIRIKCLVFPDESVWDEALLELAGIAVKNEVRTAVIHAGEVVRGKELEIKCLYPTYLSAIEIGNATSMVLDISHYEWDMLFTGDIERDGEKKLIDLLEKKYEVLKVAHHGSKNSTKEEFLELVCPKIGLISAGKHNAYGHPHAETVERLEAAECRIYSTSGNGAVVMKTEGKRVAKLEIFQYNNGYEKFE